MGPKKSWIDKTKAQKFTLVHRSHQDPLYYDEESSNAVLVPVSSVANGNPNDKVRTVQKEELMQVEREMKQNEGHAAGYGITFDDSEYDYMQHLKPMGKASGAIFISAATAANNVNSKDKHKNSKLAQLLDESMLPSAEVRKYDYQQQQDIPDEIKGFKPNLNEDLREALTALEDENYLDEEQDVDEVDVFTELLGGESGGKKQVELSLNEYDRLNEDYYDEDDNEDWDYDEYDEGYAEAEGGAKGEFDWEKDFSKFKKSQNRKQNDWDSDDEFEEEDEEEEEEEEEEDTVGDLPDLQNLKSSKSAKKKSKRNKGAKTDTSSYSMSSSAIARTEQMTIIDDKFDVLKEKYEKADEEDQEEYQPFDLNNERDDFMDMVDDFLDNYEMENRNRRIVKKNPEMESYKKAALDVTNTKMKFQKPKGLRGVIKDLDQLQL